MQHLWLQVMGWVMLFTALQGGLGALVVPLVSGGPATEICTSMGMQWVAQDALTPWAAVDGRADGTDQQPAFGKTCAWAMAHVFTSAPWGVLPQVRPHPWTEDVRVRWVASTPSVRTDVDRVLLNAPMRAPPAALA